MAVPYYLPRSSLGNGVAIVCSKCCFVCLLSIISEYQHCYHNQLSLHTYSSTKPIMPTTILHLWTEMTLFMDNTHAQGRLHVKCGWVGEAKWVCHGPIILSVGSWHTVNLKPLRSLDQAVHYAHAKMKVISNVMYTYRCVLMVPIQYNRISLHCNCNIGWGKFPHPSSYKY